MARYRTTSRDGRSVYEHVLVAEAALGRPLPRGAEVHHVDRNTQHNWPGNLVICPNRHYHRLLHARQRALDACGHADWRKCIYCKQWDAPENLSTPKGRSSWFHLECKAAWMRCWSNQRQGREPSTTVLFT